MSERKSNKTFKLYINSKHQRFWDIIKHAEKQGVNPSDYICKSLITNFNKEVPEPPKAFVPALLELAERYEEQGIDGCQMSYKIPKMFDRMQISNDEMTILTIFAIQLYITILKNDGIQKILETMPEKMLRTRKDIESLRTMDEFKSLLSSKMVLNMDRLQKQEQDRIKQEQDEFQKQQQNLLAEKLASDKKEWEEQNPDKPYWQKNMTDEEIETSNKIASGEWEIVDDSYRENSEYEL
jgi:hypothetical protein